MGRTKVVNRRRFAVALLASGILWLVLALFMPKAGQTKVWYLSGREYLSDYFMPRNTAAHANPYREPAHTLEFAYLRGGEVKEGPGWDLEERDRAYPAGALLPLLPFAESLAGARTCNAVMIGFFVVVLVVCLRGTRWMLLLGLLLSGPMLFAYERGNPIWYAAAGTLLFLLYWDHPRRWIRWTAAAGLAIAASIKVMPAVLGVLYLGQVVEAWRGGAWGHAPYGVRVRKALLDPVVCVGLGVVAFVIPWLFVSGFESFGDWWRTGHENVAFYAPRTTFGFVGIYRTMMIALHQGWEGTAGFVLARWANILCGFGALALSVRELPRSRYAGVLFATTGMLLVSSNMRPYTVLYLLPALILWLDEKEGSLSATEAIAWFVIWTPLQVPFCSFQLYPLQNLALLMLCICASGSRCVRLSDGRVEVCGRVGVEKYEPVRRLV